MSITHKNYITNVRVVGVLGEPAIGVIERNYALRVIKFNDNGLGLLDIQVELPDISYETKGQLKFVPTDPTKYQFGLPTMPNPTLEKIERDAKHLENLQKKIAFGKDPVNHPSHYTKGKVEAIDAIESATVGLEGIEAVCTANAIKYLYRWKQKNGIEDLKKARWYIDRLIGEVK